MEGPGSLWTNDVKNKKKCHGNSNAGDNDCDWNTCVECKDFWTLHKGKRGNQWLNRRIRLENSFSVSIFLDKNQF